MNAAPNFSESFWHAAITGPVYLAMLAAGVGLLCRRQAAPRACTLAGTAILAALLAQVMLDAFRGWVMREMNAAPASRLGVPEWQLIRLMSLAVNGLVVAAAVLAVAWAVVLDRHPGGERRFAP